MDSLSEEMLSNCTILLVEDEKPLRESFSKVLKLWVKDVIEASNGEEALQLYERYHPHIIITDIKMPTMSGLELVQAIRPINKTIPIVVTSAYADQAFLLESIKLSLVEYLIKPIQESDLMRVLDRCAQILLENRPQNVHLSNLGTYDYLNKCFIPKNKEPISLTPKEVELIELLLSHKGSLFTKQRIEEHLYLYEEAPPSALKNLIFKLRKKLNCELIETVGKLGYRIA
jgi:DNA-binding response OmpR family regulator